MLKTVLTSFVTVLCLLAVVAAVIGGAQVISVPVGRERYEDCRNTAKAEKNNHPDCKTRETLWDRGLADPIAYYTLWLTFFTLALATVGTLQGILIRQQIRLARDEFNATHR